MILNVIFQLLNRFFSFDGICPIEFLIATVLKQGNWFMKKLEWTRKLRLWSKLSDGWTVFSLNEYNFIIGPETRSQLANIFWLEYFGLSVISTEGFFLEV